MPTVHEILKQSGFSDEQINTLDQRAITAFSGVLSAAEQAREAAELAQRSNADFYQNQIVPSLTAWDEERARIDNERARAVAEAAFYRTQAEAARQTGFIPADAPGYQPRDNQGRYVAGAPGSVPGSPTFDVNQVYQRAGDAVGVLTDIQWEHQRLFNQPMPISPTELIRRADAVKLDPRTYAAREFNWDQKRQELQKQEQEQHDLKIRQEAIAENDRKWAERTGSNPDIRRAETSRFSDAARAVKTGERPDPLLMNDQQRRAHTAQAIHKEIAEVAAER
jgi:hypothetical protein